MERRAMIVYVIAFSHGDGIDSINAVALDETTAQRLVRETARDLAEFAPPLEEWRYGTRINEHPGPERRVEWWTHEEYFIRIITIEAEGAPC
jgi:hypothetical protein